MIFQAGLPQAAKWSYKSPGWAAKRSPMRVAQKQNSKAKQRETATHAPSHFVTRHGRHAAGAIRFIIYLIINNFHFLIKPKKLSNKYLSAK